MPDPDATATGLGELGLERDGDRLAVDDRHVVLRKGDAHEGERRCSTTSRSSSASADASSRRRARGGSRSTNVVDAPNTLAVFVRGPDRIRLEYVEHKPGFSLV